MSLAECSFFMIKNSAEPDEMSRFATYHPGLHCFLCLIYIVLGLNVLIDNNMIGCYLLIIQSLLHFICPCIFVKIIYFFNFNVI